MCGHVGTGRLWDLFVWIVSLRRKGCGFVIWPPYEDCMLKYVCSMQVGMLVC